MAGYGYLYYLPDVAYVIVKTITIVSAVLLVYALAELLRPRQRRGGDTWT